MKIYDDDNKNRENVYQGNYKNDDDYNNRYESKVKHRNDKSHNSR